MMKLRGASAGKATYKPSDIGILVAQAALETLRNLDPHSTDSTCLEIEMKFDSRWQ